MELLLPPVGPFADVLGDYRPYVTPAGEASICVLVVVELASRVQVVLRQRVPVALELVLGYRVAGLAVEAALCRLAEIPIVCGYGLGNLMEPIRPNVDRQMLSFVNSYALSPSDSVLRDDGVCRLHPQLAHEAAARLAVDDRVMQEVVGQFVQELRAIANDGISKRDGVPLTDVSNCVVV